jgi:hypothetical protein
VARFDRVIPPGGTGTVILTVDTERIRGEFEKKATIWSNDPDRKSMVVELIGEVRPYISLEPGGYVSLWGSQADVPTAHVAIINNREQPLEILSIRPDDVLKDRIKWRLERVKPGFTYRLEIDAVPGESGEYTGHLFIQTNLPEKPELSVIVNGDIKPKTPG